MIHFDNFWRRLQSDRRNECSFKYWGSTLFKPHRFVPKTAVAAALAATGMAAHATTPFVVQDIRIDGLQRIEPGSVFAYLPIRQGDTFTDDKASEAIRALYATGFFNDVQVVATVVSVHEGDPALLGGLPLFLAGEMDDHDSRYYARAAAPAKRAFRRRIAFVCSWETRDSVTPSTSPISRSVSSS